jgi:magnesium chelatase accessory protein
MNRREGGTPFALTPQQHTVGALRWYSEHSPGPPDAPLALLLHGTGASAHSWHALAACMHTRFALLAPDLPGHARTQTPAHQPLDLPAVARALGEWLAVQQRRPALIIGHSAGAAIALRMVLDRQVDGVPVVSINGALLPPAGWPGELFLPLARRLVQQPRVPRMFARVAAQPLVVRRLLSGTGSRLDEAGIERYAQLLSRPQHAADVLRLMASWDLAPLAADLSRLASPLHLVVGLNDRTVPPEQARRVRASVGHARLSELQRLGHLAHEEDAPAVWEAIASAWPG